MAPFTRWAALGFCALVLTTVAGSWLGQLYLDGGQSVQTLRTDIVTSGSPIANAATEAQLLGRFLTNKFPDIDVTLAANKLRISISHLNASDLAATQASLRSAITEFTTTVEQRLQVEKAQALVDFQSASNNAAIYEYLSEFRKWEWLESINLAPRLEVAEFVNWDSSARKGARAGAAVGFGLGLVTNLILAISLYRRRDWSRTQPPAPTIE